jgi:hypothetical protein
MTLRSWTRNLFARPATRPIRKRPHRASPALEALEDRCVPSTLTVTSSADDVTQNHTLRYAVAHAKNGDTIQITAEVKDAIVLTHGELLVSQDVTIQSVAARTPTISGNGVSRVFEIAAGANVALQNLHITGGNGLADNPSGTAADDGLGGAILDLGTLAVNGCTVSGNSASRFGGGLFSSYGTATVGTSTFSGNSAAYGGGAFNLSGSLTADGCTFSGNSASVYGGGAYNSGGSLTADGCTFTGNTAALGGGAYNSGGSLTADGCTFSGNSASVYGGGLFNFGGTATFTDSTLTNNSATYGGGGLYNFSGTLTVGSCTFSGNTPDAIGGTGYNDLGGNSFL